MGVTGMFASSKQVPAKAQARRHTVRVRMNDAEVSALDSYARSIGARSRSEALRAIPRGVREVPKQPDASSMLAARELKRASGQLAAIGRNVNQIARNINVVGLAKGSDIDFDKAFERMELKSRLTAFTAQLEELERTLAALAPGGAVEG